MSPKSDLEYLLSKEYEPEEQSPHKFLQSYRLLADHRDDLQEQCKAKAKRRAEKKASEAPAPAPKVSGSRFNPLSSTEENPRPPPHKFAGKLTDDQLRKLSKEGRKAQVARIQDDIQFLKNEKKELRAAGREESKDEKSGEGVTEESDQDV